MIVLAIRFILELGGVAGLGFLGATAPTDAGWPIVLGIGAPVILIVVWSAVVAPRAANPLPLRVRELVGTALLVLVAFGLGAAGHPGWGIAFGAAVLLDQALILATGATVPVGTATAGMLPVEGRS